MTTSCLRPGTTGGECILADGQAIYNELAESQPDALRAFHTPHSVRFGGAAGHLGAIFTDVDTNRVILRLRLDDLAQFSPAVNYWLPALRAAIYRHALTVMLKPGDGYILDNHRWLHGRQPFSGPRVLCRILGNPLPHLMIATGVRPRHKLAARSTA